MRPLVLFDAELAELARIRKYADENPIHLARILRQAKRAEGWIDHANGVELYAGEISGHVAFIPVGFKVVFSIDELPLTDGTGTNWFEHLSVSVDGGLWPNQYSVLMIMDALKMPHPNQCRFDSVNGKPPYYDIMAAAPPEKAAEYARLTAGKS